MILILHNAPVFIILKLFQDVECDFRYFLPNNRNIITAIPDKRPMFPRLTVSVSRVRVSNPPNFISVLIFMRGKNENKADS